LFDRQSITQTKKKGLKNEEIEHSTD